MGVRDSGRSGRVSEEETFKVRPEGQEDEKEPCKEPEEEYSEQKEQLIQKL